MIRRIVTDSSADLALMTSDRLSSVPLKILLGGREYVDDARLDVPGFIAAMTVSKERSTSSCPNVYDWLEAFEGADEVFAVAISSHMSGSFGSAGQAAAEYMEKHPRAKVRVIDSRSASAGITVQVERLMALCDSDRSFEQICAEFDAYQPHVHLVFGMESVSNFVKNGRLPAVVGAVAGILNLRFVNRASAEGKFEQLHKVRGTAKLHEAMFRQVVADGYAGGRLIIHHVQNERAAQLIRDKVLAQFPRAEVVIDACRGLCSYYAEANGLLLGFEDASVPRL